MAGDGGNGGEDPTLPWIRLANSEVTFECPALGWRSALVICLIPPSTTTNQPTTYDNQTEPTKTNY